MKAAEIDWFGILLALFALLVAAMFLSSCAGVSFSSPYVDITSDKDGNVRVVPKAEPIIIPTK